MDSATHSTSHRSAHHHLHAGSRLLHQRLGQVLNDSILALIARFAIASIFFLSGRTKVEGFLSIKDSTYFLFEQEYQVPVISPVLAAHMATYAEHLFPTLLVLGLFTRLSALALFTMTLVIQVFVYPGAWPTHLSWAALLLYLMAKGGGRFSVDHAWSRK